MYKPPKVFFKSIIVNNPEIKKYKLNKILNSRYINKKRKL